MADQREQAARLAEQCQTASAPSRDLDAAIWSVRNAKPVTPALVAPYYTASIDTALSLLEEGWLVGEIAQNWRVRSGPGWRVRFEKAPSEKLLEAFNSGRTVGITSEEAEAATAALAVCAAALMIFARP